MTETNESDLIRAIMTENVNAIVDDIASLRACGAVVDVSSSGIHVKLPPDVKANDLRLVNVTLLNTGIAVADARSSS